MSSFQFKTLAIPARDGFPLSARTYSVPGPIPGRGVVIIHAATAVPQKIYAPFANYLRDNGFIVITYDYRGIADSKDLLTPINKFPVTMLDWAQLDADGVHDWVQTQYPDLPISVVGHSFGGQGLGLLENAKHIRKVVMVASQNGYWRYFNPKNQPFMFFNWYVLFPLFLFFMNYIPMRKLGQGEDLPGGVAQQWRNWCVHPDYLFSELNETQKQAYKNFPAPILSFGFSDDAFAGGNSMEKLIERYPSSATLKKLAPQDLGVKKIGHFGFFKPKFRETLWAEARDWLRA